MKDDKVFGLSSTLFLIGISLVSLAFFGPDAAGPRFGSFFSDGGFLHLGQLVQSRRRVV